MSRARQLADAYGRYAALIAAQIQAVDADDPDTFERLAQERDQVAGDIDLINRDFAAETASLDAIARQLELCLSADRDLHARLEALHAESIQNARRLDANRAAIRSYIRTADGPARFDLSL